MIDAGVSMRRLKQELTKNGFTYDDIDAVLITHDHMDHIHNLGPYCKRLLKPVWMTRKLRSSLATHWMTGEYLTPVVKQLQDGGWSEIVPGKVRARYFIVPHDATQTVGYCIDLHGYIFVIMTDIGRMTDEAIAYARQASTVVIESNYDLDMLRGGSYPIELQNRICSGFGHLSNEECADAIRDFLHPGLSNVFLCHLSENNNTHELVHDAVKEAISERNIPFHILERRGVTGYFDLD